MGQYNKLKILIKREARTNHKCFSCGTLIKSGEIYYSEELSDKYINYPQKKKFCVNCYTKICQHKEKK